jgi:hypothetical protein
MIFKPASTDCHRMTRRKMSCHNVIRGGNATYRPYIPSDLFRDLFCSVASGGGPRGNAGERGVVQ